MPVATLEMHETKTVGKFEQMVTDPAGCGEYSRTFGSRQCLPSDRTWLLQKALAEEGYGSDTVRALMIGDECPIRLKQALQVLASVARNRRCRYKNLYLSWALRLTPLVVSLKHQVRTWTRHPCLKPPCSKIGDAWYWGQQPFVPKDRPFPLETALEEFVTSQVSVSMEHDGQSVS